MSVQHVTFIVIAVYKALLLMCAAFRCVLWAESIPFACRKLMSCGAFCGLLTTEKRHVILSKQFVFTVVVVVLSH